MPVATPDALHYPWCSGAECDCEDDGCDPYEPLPVAPGGSWCPACEAWAVRYEGQHVDDFGRSWDTWRCGECGGVEER